MTAPILVCVAVLLATGIYLVLDRTLLRVIIGLGLLSNGTNLALLSTGGLEPAAPPIVGETAKVAGRLVDPLPQALILTAIVIGFGVTALLLTLGYRTYQAYESDDLGELHGRLRDE